METFISVEKARSSILDRLSAGPIETVPLAGAGGRTLAFPAVSRDDIPPFANSAMDGYAVRTADFARAEVVLSVLEDIPAGAVPAREVTAGCCSRIMTGAPVPEGADAVAPVEWTETLADGRVRFARAPQPGANVRPAGQDVRAGEQLIAAGALVTPPAIGMLATLGYARVSVYARSRVAVIATGDELVEPGAPLTPGKIRNSSGPALRAQVEACGAEALPPLLARDNPASIRAVIDEARSADVLVFAGGVSVGDYDLVKQQLDAAGMEMVFWKVKQRPGKPLAFGMLEGKPVFGLPGNPVSSAMCFDQYVRPALLRMQGRVDLQRPRHRATLAADTPKVAGLHFFMRGVAGYDANGRLSVRDTGPQGSNLYSSVLAANCIAHLPEDWEAAPAGSQVEVEWLDW